MKYIENCCKKFTNEISLVGSKVASFQNLKWGFIMLLSIYAFAMLAIIRADFAYKDDMGRKALGYIDWALSSRYLSVSLSQIIHTSSYLGDISPLPQYLAMVIIVIASLIVIMLLKSEKRITFWDIIAVLPLGLSPYFLECLSFKYDSPYMALSVLGSILPLLFYYSPAWIFCFVTVIGILVSCNTYQVSLSIFPMLVIFVSAKEIFKGQGNKMICKKIVVAVIGYLLAIFIYKMFIMPPNPLVDLVDNSMLPYNELLRGMFDNYKHYFQLIHEDFEPIYKIMVAYLCGCYVLSQLYTKQNKTISLLVAILALIISALLMFGPYVALTRPLFETRAMYGVGAWLAFIAVSCVNMSATKVPKVVTLCLGWCLIVFTFLYGNALAEQDRYTHFRMKQTISALTSIDDFKRGQDKFIQFDGAYGLSPIISNMPQSKYVLGRLIPNYSDDIVWGQFYFYHYYGLEKVEQVGWGKKRGIDLKKHNLPLVKETYYEKIYHKGDEWLIELK